MSDCLFCKIIDGTIPAQKIFENESVVCIHDLYPKAPTHVLLLPKKHIASLIDLTPEDAPLMGALTLSIPHIATQLHLEAGFKTVINTGKAGGQEIFHLHYHLLGTPAK